VTSLMRCGLEGEFKAARREGRTFDVSSSSTKVFQALQPGHFPIHFGELYPHSLHANTSLVFLAMRGC